jgi:hypothetical protein
MYDASAQRFHFSQRPGEITYREVRQGEGVPRTTSASVEPNRRNGGSRLPALTLSFAAALQGSAEQSAPKAQRTLGFVGRELDQGNDNRSMRTTREDELVPRLRTVIKHEAFALRRQRDRRLEAALARVLGLKGRDGRALVDIERAADGRRGGRERL